METFKKLLMMIKHPLFILCFLSVGLLSFNQTSESSFFPVGRLLFLIQQKEHEQALKLYQAQFQASGKHDFEILHQMGLGILDDGFRQNDPESELLALFGASVSAHEDTYYILEGSLQSRYPEIQVIALGALARFQDERANQALIRALGAPSLLVRYEAAHQLCQKKHPQAISQTESLMYKTPRALRPLYPPLFAMVGDSHSTRILKKLLNTTSDHTCLAVILSIAKYERDDLLPQIRSQASHFPFAQQEACAYTLGHLKDELALPKLQKMTTSQYPTVALAAHWALYCLGQETSIDAIEQAAQKGDLFAISMLGDIPDHPQVLLKLLQDSNLQIRMNALIALVCQHHPQALHFIHEVLIRDRRDLAFTVQSSPGKAFKAWKITPSASQLFKDDLRAYEEHSELKKSLLQKIREISEAQLIILAHQIFIKQQNDLVPYTVELLEELGTKEALECLKQHQQQLGAPLVRNYCNLALYRLQEPGPYGEQLRQWVKKQNQTQFIRFQAFSPWELGKTSYSLTPEETSKLLIDAFEAFASNQDNQGIDTLIEAIATGHPKNKYALAGLLLRATQ